MFDRLIRPLTSGAVANQAQLVRLRLSNLDYFQFTNRKFASQKTANYLFIPKRECDAEVHQIGHQRFNCR